MLWLILWGTLFGLIFYYYCIRPLSFWKKRGIKYSTNAAWIFGDNINVVLKRESFPETILRIYKEYPNERYSGLYQMTTPTLMIRDAELLKQITVKDFEYFVDHRTFVPENADPLWNRNLFALKGQRWKEMRPILSPSFTTSKMKSMFVLINEVAETFINYYKNKERDDTVEIDMKDAFGRLSNDVIASVAFGLKINSLNEKNNEFFLMGKEATDFGGFWKTLKFFGFNMFPKLYEILKVTFFSRKVSNYFMNVIEDTIKTREEQNIVRPDMINLLLEARNGNQKREETTNVETGFATVQEAYIKEVKENSKKDIEITDIAAQALIFFFGGFESVTTMMVFMAYELAVNPDIQNRLRNEIQETNQKCQGNVTYEAVMKMKYMDMVASETLRKWPNAVFVDRVCTKPYIIQPVNTREKPLHIEKGDVLWIPIYGIHLDPKYYPEPEKFDPERFNDENKHKIDPYTYLPFGLGPRNCIGSRFALMECKTLFFHFLLNFEIVPVKRTSIPMKFEKGNFNIKPEVGHWLGIKQLNL